MEYTKTNAETIDRWIDEGWEWGVPIDHETYLQALDGNWQIKLTPIKPVPRRWCGDLRGKRVLGLAAGGGQQMPILTAAGAICTVLDYSEKQLESEQLVASQEGYEIDIVRADMTKLFPFADSTFDLIVHPVSNCYIRDVTHVWAECARVLKPGGLLLAGLDNGFNYLFFDEDESHVTGSLPFDPLEDPAKMAMLQKEDAGVQFSHSIEEQIGGQLRAGFRLLDVYDDTNGSGFLCEHGVPCFWATLARLYKPTSPIGGPGHSDRLSTCRDEQDPFFVKE
ncbi:MAG: class I SAM-dependent methyltransferase [Clostridia bacterium]|nr:class I SAM-dependent methyltransferase [Clostridia bacterium]